ncbi:methyl-accepting chemotaxis protein [Neobacillus sp. PS3-40]|uniref:methyl-accepting chemotaxis protein n=1 Tax=Neobacillus sp. PS3-40 TaxID=3070679 RepID=UPI0027E10C49|nr:methyl-accepting chemotaxis protein [Neobacillus sp. PS3-40]WML43216.1 methyl-accepting chemotaxis protein [Neobacillus sp. PS3-40]
MKNSLKVRIMVQVSILILLSCIGLSYLTNYTYSNLLINTISNQSLELTKSAEKMIDQDQFKDLAMNLNKNNYYYDLKDNLNGIRKMNGLKFLYTMSRKKDGNHFKYFYVVDGYPNGSKNESPLGEEEKGIKDSPKLIKAFDTGKAQIGEMSTMEEYGTLISTYVPIKSKQGEVIGVVGADFNAAIVDAKMKETNKKQVIFTIVILLVSLLILFMITSYIVKPLRMLTSKVKEIGKGNLTVTVEDQGKDEIGQLSTSIQLMVNDLKQIIGGILTVTSKLHTSSESILQNAQETKDASQEMVHSLEEVASGIDVQFNKTETSTYAMEEMSLGVQTIASMATSVSELSLSALQETEEGKNIANQMMNQIQVLNQTFQETAHLMKDLDVRSKKINEVTNVIKEISSQTNLLALNAAIEAARAGEHGKGFSVVAEEVRKLAEQSESSAATITSIISKINEVGHSTFVSMSKVENVVEKSIEEFHKMDRSYEHIYQSIRNMTSSIQEVSASAEEMAVSSEEVSASLSETFQIAKGTEHNTKLMVASTNKQEEAINEMFLDLKSLVKMTDELTDLTQKFEL